MAEETLTIDRAEWSAKFAELLQPAVEEIAPIQAQVQSGRAQLFMLQRDGAVIGAFVLRIDDRTTGKDGVIVAAAGDGDDINLTATMLPFIETMFKGCDRIRIHTARPGLAKLLAAYFGYRLMELVLVKDIPQ